MRILAQSPLSAKGLISIAEAPEYGPQTVVFCVPIDTREAERMNSIFDFENYFAKGISTKIMERKATRKIFFRLHLT